MNKDLTKNIRKFGLLIGLLLCLLPVSFYIIYMANLQKGEVLGFFLFMFGMAIFLGSCTFLPVGIHGIKVIMEKEKAEFTENHKMAFLQSPKIQIQLYSDGKHAFVRIFNCIPSICTVRVGRVTSDLGYFSDCVQFRIHPNPEETESEHYVKINSSKLQRLVFDRKLKARVTILGGFSYTKIIHVNDWPVLSI